MHDDSKVQYDLWFACTVCACCVHNSAWVCRWLGTSVGVVVDVLCRVDALKSVTVVCERSGWMCSGVAVTSTGMSGLEVWTSVVESEEIVKLELSVI